MPSAASGSRRRGPPGDLVHILTQLWADQGVDTDGNALVAELIREKIRGIVKDPETAAALSPPTIRSGPSVPASIPTITPPIIAPMSAW